MGPVNSEPEDTSTQTSRSDRQLAELRRRCDDLTDFLENASVALHRVGPDGTILWANRAELQLLGYPESAFIGRNMADFHADPPALSRIMSRLQAGEPVQNCEAVLRCADGSLKDVLVDSSVRWESGRFLHTRCFIRDNTEAKRAEKALRESEQRYRTLFETTLDAILVVDETGQFMDANESLCHILGAPRERLIGTHFSRFVPNSGLEDAARLFVELKGKGEFRGRFPMITEDGEIVQLDWASRANFLPGLHLCVARDVTEQVRTEERLKRSHERYKAFVAQSSEGIWRMELEPPLDVSLPEDEQIRNFYAAAVLAECNAEFAGMYGFGSVEDVAGSRLERLLPPSRHNLEYLRAFIRSGYRLSNAESHERDARGESRYILNHLIGVVEDGRLLRAWGTQRDITAQKRTARRLWDAQSRLALRNGILAGITSGLSTGEAIRQTVEQVHLCFPELRCGYSAIDGNGMQRVVCSMEPEGMGAVPAEVSVPAPYLEALRHRETIIVQDIEGDPRCDDHRSILTAAGTRALLEAPLWHGSDQLAVLFFHAPEPRRWTDHEITTLREVARDLAAAIQKASDQEARLRAQVALEASEKRLRLALAAGRMSCWECDLAGEVITYTSAPDFSSTVPPASLGELIGRIHEEDRPHVAECLRMAREGGGAFHVEYRMTVPGGSHQWIETRAEAHRDHTGRWSRIIGVSSDVSERRQSEEALRHRQKLEGLGVLAGGVAHDFNNLLTGILGNATLATEMMEQNHPARVLVDDVCLASERAAELTRQLLAYAGKGRYVLAPLNLSSLVQDTCRLIQLSIPKKAALRLNLSDDMPSVDADRGQLQQIVMNLVLNAGEAAANRETPEIRVSTRVAEIDRARLRRMAPATGIEPGTYVVLSVEDNGSGMDEATKAKIFDPFFTTKATGRGLGLAAVHGIVRAHHGALSVTSAPDCGTVFEVLFPVSEAYAERSALRRGALRKAVLVVDADEPPRLRAAEILAEAGYDALVAEDAQSAAEALRGRDDVVAVLMDAATAAGALPEMRKVQPGVPVLISCASGEPDSVHSAGFVPKPFSTSTLLSKLEALTNTAVAAAASADGVSAADLRSPNKNQA